MCRHVQVFEVLPIVPRQTEVALDDGFLSLVCDVIVKASELLDTERHIHVPFLAHEWIGIHCCVVLCAERNGRRGSMVFSPIRVGDA